MSIHKYEFTDPDNDNDDMMVVLQRKSVMEGTLIRHTFPISDPSVPSIKDSHRQIINGIKYIFFLFSCKLIEYLIF